jgi:hypothetical protein
MSFKHTFLAVAAVVLVAGLSLILLVGLPTAGEAAFIPSVEAPMQSTSKVVQVTHASPIQTTVPIQTIVPVTQLLLPIPPSWPIKLNYQDWQRDHDYYTAWLHHANPHIRFRAVHAIVTGYCPCTICCGPNACGITRRGIRTDDQPYGVACADALAHVRVHIPGYLPDTKPGQFWLPDDTGDAMNDDWKERRVYHFDVRFINHASAVIFGRREITVYIAEKGKHE